MDRYWQEVVDFLQARDLAGADLVAPIELGAAVAFDFGYSNVGPDDAERIRSLVLHKGRYQELDAGFVQQVMGRLGPVFANEVFIVLSDGGQHLPEDHPHIGSLREIRAWAASRRGASEQPKRRMAATYLSNDAVLAETAHGHLMVLPAGDRAITPHIIRDGYFDLGMTRFLDRFLRPGMIFVDVGANIGVYTLLAAAAVGAGGRVIAIEASPRLQTYLIDNFSMNGFLDRAQLLPFAAADRAGELTFYDFDRYNGGSTAVAEVAQRAEKRLLDPPRQIQVPARTLSALMHEAGATRADLIKIDVEGFEWEVLQGARDFLATQENIHLVLEWHSEFMSPERQDVLYRTLTKELGCHLELVEPDGSTRPVGFDELRLVDHADIFVYRNDRPTD